MAVFYCPSCQYLKTVADEHLGRSASCPKCKERGSICDPQTLFSQRPKEEQGGNGTTGLANSPPLVHPRHEVKLPSALPLVVTDKQVHTPPQGAFGKTMGKCPLCGEATFDLSDHYVRKHPHSMASGSLAPPPPLDGMHRVDGQATRVKSDDDGHRPASPMDPLYVQARNVNEGMHRFHKYSKLIAFACMGFALWANDLADNWVGFLCNHVDNATQSTIWAWTAGWFAPAPPAITPLYRTYNFIMTVVAVVGMVIVSRWFFWTRLMMKLEASRSASPPASLDNLLNAIVSDHKRFCAWWVAEYLGLGALAHFVYGLFFQGWLGWGQQRFAIPIQPTVNAVAMAVVSTGTISLLSEHLVTLEDKKVRRKQKRT